MPDTLADIVREARRRKELSLRELARRIAVSPAYLCDIENEMRTPADRVIERLAHEIGWDPELLFAAAGRMGEAAQRYLKRRPEAARLMRKIVELDLTERELERLLAALERIAGGQDEQSR